MHRIASPHKNHICSVQEYLFSIKLAGVDNQEQSGGMITKGKMGAHRPGEMSACVKLITSLNEILRGFKDQNLLNQFKKK